LKTELKKPVTLDVALTCPGLSELGPWQASEPGPEPGFEPRCGRLRWSVELPAGAAERIWTWG
jgi:glucoamylase